MKRLKLLTATFAFAILGVAALVVPGTTHALDPLAVCDDAANTGNQVCQNRTENANELIYTIVNTLLFIIGVLAVVMIIWGGIMYTTSAGDAGRIKKAKDTLTYSIVGLVIAFLAFAIVNWVIKQIK